VVSRSAVQVRSAGNRQPAAELAETWQRVKTRKQEIRHYLATGDHDDPLFGAWDGGIFEGGRQAAEALKSALIAEVRRRSAGKRPPPVPKGLDLRRFTREKVGPMVCGLFPKREREPVLETLERSVVFVTSRSLERVIQKESWLPTAWTVANLYLGSVDAELLGPEAPNLVGLSQGTTCYVSTSYFATDDKFADFVLHEAAHIFHNCKRSTVGLPETRTREWLLNIDFGMRETFAYACEAYGRIRELGRGPARRTRLLTELAQGAMPPDGLVEEDEFLDILGEAVAARNGWKRILARCAAKSRTGA
jgi:hypothetical protein